MIKVLLNNFIDLKKYNYLFLLVFLMLGFFIGIFWTRYEQNPLITTTETQLPQDATLYLNPQSKNQLLMTPQQVLLNKNEYLRQFFKPWTPHFSPIQYREKVKNPPIIILSDIKSQLRLFNEQPGYGMNFHRYDSKWIKTIAKNINLSSYPNQNKPGIIIHNTSLRLLPTNEPVYFNYQQAGQGYPFDDLQLSAQWTGKPILITHLTRDRTWAYVITNDGYGWVQMEDIAFVNHSFIENYQHTTFAAITKDNVAISDHLFGFMTETKIGQIFPIKNHELFIPLKQLNQYALLTPVRLAKTNYQLFPLKPTAENFSKIINRLLGETYGWGGLDNYRDCSQTLQNLFTVFAVYLPRDSLDQKHQGQFVDLSNYSVKDKSRYIVEHSKPFLTLLGLPGHIMLYMGNLNGKPVVFQNKWGFHTKNIFGDEGRSVIGKSLISTLDVNHDVKHAEQKTQLEILDSFTLLKTNT